VNPAKIASELQVRTGISRALWLLLAASIASSLFLSAYVALRQDRERVVFMPPQIERGFWIEADQVSKEYLEQMGLFVVQLAFNATPASVDYQNAALLKYAAPEAYGALEKAGRLAAERLKRDQVSTVFAPRSVVHDKEGRPRVVFIGELVTYVTDKLSGRKSVAILVEFRHSGGRTHITALRETSTDDPIGEKPAHPQ
jgi:conjugal transfer pilus assembly protein TraE